MRTPVALLTLGLVQDSSAAFAASGELASYFFPLTSLNLFTGAGTNDQKKLGATMNYSYDLDAKTKWTREDNPTLWYVGAFGLKAEAYAELEVVLDFIVAQYRIVLPFNFLDVSPFEFYYLSSEENDLYCAGSFYYYNFFNVIPYYVENWQNCHFSIIGRILATLGVSESWLNTRDLAFDTWGDIFECSATGDWTSPSGIVGGATETFYDRDNLTVSLLPNLGFEWI